MSRNDVAPDEFPTRPRHAGEALSTRYHPRDVAGLLAIPVVLAGVMALPESTRRGLAFHYAEPTVLTAYTAHFVHLSPEHLLANLVGYGLLAGLCYVVALLGDDRSLFAVATVTVLVAFPPLLSGLNLAVPRDAIGYGFSGINMALFGLLPLLLVRYVRTAYGVRLERRDAMAVFFAVLAWMTLLALPVDAITVLLTVATGSIAVGYASDGLRGRLAARRRTLQCVVDSGGYGTTLAVACVVLAGYPVVGFPVDPTGDGVVLNLYVHLLAFCLAFIAAFVLTAVLDRRG